MQRPWIVFFLRVSMKLTTSCFAKCLFFFLDKCVYGDGAKFCVCIVFDLRNMVSLFRKLCGKNPICPRVPNISESSGVIDLFS